MYSPAIICVKFAILLLYLRIFSHGTSRHFRLYVYGIMAFVFAYSFAGFWIQIFACIPQDKIWDVKIQRGHCVNRNGLSIASSVLNIFTDLLMIIIPVPMVWRLQMPVGQKLSVIFMFGVACL